MQLISKLWPYAAHCANEYAKEKNTTILAIYYGTLLMSISNLLNNIFI